MLLTKEHYDLMARFEANYKNKRLDREDKSFWSKGHVYEDGRVPEILDNDEINRRGHRA